jgi:hypothetical protein
MNGQSHVLRIMETPHTGASLARGGTRSGSTGLQIMASRSGTSRIGCQCREKSHDQMGRDQMDKKVTRKWRKMLVRGLITPSEHMLFRKIMELELENAQLREAVERLRGPAKSIGQVSDEVDKLPARDLGNKNPVPVDLQSRQRNLPSNHEPTLKELCRPLSAKAAARSFRL